MQARHRLVAIFDRSDSAISRLHEAHTKVGSSTGRPAASTGATSPPPRRRSRLIAEPPTDFTVNLTSFVNRPVRPVR
jgi:hypothetical protein